MNVSHFFSLLREPARARAVAVQTQSEGLDYAVLLARVDTLADVLAVRGATVVASLMDNGLEWIVLDLACLQAGVVHVPLPLFFTPGQWRETLDAAGVNAVVGPASLQPMLQAFGFENAAQWQGHTALFRRAFAKVPLPAGTAKITFTSGSTGSPKGVCLGADQMLAVAGGLAAATQPLGIARHFTALPLPVLLENIAGVYAPLIAGATICVNPLKDIGLQGSSRFDPAVFHQALVAGRAQSVIVLPQMLRAYAGWLRAAGLAGPGTLRFVAVGGAAVGSDLLECARAQGIPAYEGYGLSEACSVQTLNLPGADCPGSAGRPLPHARVRVAADGEIEVAGALALGYLGQPAMPSTWLPTGDLGRIDDAGFLHIRGRKKNVLITGYGRNVSPEWVELRLANQPVIAHCVVLGEGQAALGAVIWPLGNPSDSAIQACVDQVNQGLPDYARIGSWMRARAEFSATSGLATVNGRPRRQAVAELHADLFSAGYRSTIDVDPS
ncbi:AMP-binding protein [Achromobacter mucicolens]|uniref:AMP-binding protein n=1 Tax=Achromobacter mucicolens TaxID=1389922 RepID=UPI00244B9772|nr:AMP-binding protein [Achromobacter mucicolens]MDH0090320.1 AMP-binding protein [Achromobacter mucicolens]